MFIIEATGRKAFSQIFETKQIFAKMLVGGKHSSLFRWNVDGEEKSFSNICHRSSWLTM